MQTIVYFVVMFSISEANNLDVYLCNNKYSKTSALLNNEGTGNYNNLKNYCKKLAAKDHVAVSAATPLYTFGYYNTDVLKMNISVRNQPQDVTTKVFLKKDSGEATEKGLEQCIISEKKECPITHFLKDDKQNIFLELVFHSTRDVCSRKIIAKGQQLYRLQGENSNTYDDICLTSESCVVIVDMKNIVCGQHRHKGNPVGVLAPVQVANSSKEHNVFTDRTPPPVTIGTTTDKICEYCDNTKVPSSPGMPVYVYVILFVIVMCLLAFLICTSVKKYCHRNEQPVETIELNTYAVNEIVYADLSLASGNRETTKCNEESPYAEIIGVMRPDDRNVKKK